MLIERKRIFKRIDENIFIFLVVTIQRYRKSYKTKYGLHVIRFRKAKNIYKGENASNPHDAIRQKLKQSLKIY